MSVMPIHKTTKLRTAVADRVGRDEAMAIANGFILRHLRDRCMAGLPAIVEWNGRRVWVAPILLTYPGKGIVGEVGMIAVDSQRGRVCAHTPKADLDIAAAKITRGRWNEIEAAFRRVLLYEQISSARLSST